MTRFPVYFIFLFLSLLATAQTDVISDTITPASVPVNPRYFLPPVFTGHQNLDSVEIERYYPEGQAFDWLEAARFERIMASRVRQDYMISHPELVMYMEDKLPEPPKKYSATIDPETAKIVISEVKPELVLNDVKTDIGRRHWLKVFNGSMQFTQAYISPNWYQGGNSNLNTLLNLYYDVKLNQVYHPNWLFQTTFQYKLGLNNAPDDSVRSYNISEDLLQISMMAGYKAAHRWYYSTNAMFKTQLSNSYKSNTHDLKSAFMSPGEVNVGFGMTYNYFNKPKTFTFDMALSPVSYNLKTCINSRVSPRPFGIEVGRTTKSELGSNMEIKMNWKMHANIRLVSRFFAFTNYNYLQADWENTFMFNITKYLTTQIYVNMRYDTTNPRVEDTHWHKLQLKEILSFGIAYNFSSI